MWWKQVNLATGLALVRQIRRLCLAKSACGEYAIARGFGDMPPGEFFKLHACSEIEPEGIFKNM